jgi:2',3'-cyclic-nucleotide 2'-phosphodiesterase (5'-nucleotidase family)
VVIAKDGNLIGETSVFLEGRRTEVRTEETNLGNLSADANLATAQLVDPTVVASIKNGGGIRAEIGEIDNTGGSTVLLPPSENPLVAGDKDGDISQLDIENSLRFNNSLALVTATADELKATLEHAVAATGPGATPGQFAQVGGLRYSFDPTAPVGSRVQSLAIVDGSGAITDVVVDGGVVQGDPARTFRLVTLGFLATGGDSYPFPTFAAPDLVDLAGNPAADQGTASFADPGTEQDALAEHLIANYGIGNATPFADAETAPVDDERIQDLSVRPDTVLTP